MLNWILTLVLTLSGIVLTQTAILHYEFSDRAKGYMLSAAKRIWPFLAIIIVIETIFGTVLTVVLGFTEFVPLPQPLLAILVGILVVLLPNTFEYFVLYRNVSEKKLRNPLVKALNKLNLAIIRKFGGSIRTLMQQDVHDAHRGRGFSISRDEMARRIRQIYYCHAQEIARERKDPELMRRDADFWPFEHLYLLLEHLGRERVRDEIENPPDLEWDGEEKRRQRGTISNRKNVEDQTSLPSRYYDDPKLIQRIEGRQPRKIKAASLSKAISNPPVEHVHMTDVASNRTKVFISYSHKDNWALERLQTHLRPLEREGVVDHWADTRIRTGQRWNEEIKKALASAKVAVLLISADFLASDFINKEELPPLLAAEETEGLVVMPVILGHCRFDRTLSLSRFQAVNSPSKPLSSLSEGERDAIWDKLTRDIETALYPR